MRTSIMAMHAMIRRQAISRKVLGNLLMVAAWLVLGMTSAHAGNTVTTVTYVYTNAQGTPLAKADAQGNIIARYTYRPYGSQQSGPTSKGPGYTGHVNDPDTGLVYMQQRYYDPTVGRFISPDPVAPAAGNVFNFNRYVYANNNPVRFTDPDGKQSVGEMIDSAAQGCGAVSCAGYAVLHAAWAMTGAEPLSQVADKGWSNVSTGDKVGAVAAVASVVPVGRAVGKLAEGAEAAKAVFWSGSSEAKVAAEAFAKDIGGKTLEMTSKGKILNAITTKRTFSILKPAWEKASSSFAKSAEGQVHVFQSVKGVRTQSVWATKEYPILREKGNEIIYHITD